MSHPRLPLVLALAWGLGSTPALAVKVGGTLYVKTKNTHMKDSVATSAKTLVVLQPGRAVVYEGRVEATPWCQVTAESDKKAPLKGLIFQSSLSAIAPSQEVSRQNPGKPMSPEAFASSGAAIKALGPGALAYGQTLSRDQSALQLKALVAKVQGIDAPAVARYVRERDQAEAAPPAGKARGSGKSTASPAREKKK